MTFFIWQPERGLHRVNALRVSRNVNKRDQNALTRFLIHVYPATKEGKKGRFWTLFRNSVQKQAFSRLYVNVYLEIRKRVSAHGRAYLHPTGPPPDWPAGSRKQEAGSRKQEAVIGYC
jgi:hypothetical protein